MDMSEGDCSASQGLPRDAALSCGTVVLSDRISCLHIILMSHDSYFFLHTCLFITIHCEQIVSCKIYSFNVLKGSI